MVSQWSLHGCKNRCTLTPKILYIFWIEALRKKVRILVWKTFYRSIFQDNFLLRVLSLFKKPVPTSYPFIWIPSDHSHLSSQTKLKHFHKLHIQLNLKFLWDVSCRQRVWMILLLQTPIQLPKSEYEIFQFDFTVSKLTTPTCHTHTYAETRFVQKAFASYVYLIFYLVLRSQKVEKMERRRTCRTRELGNNRLKELWSAERSRRIITRKVAVDLNISIGFYYLILSKVFDKIWPWSLWKNFWISDVWVSLALHKWFPEGYN